jgi:hypothetical protein
MEALRSSETSVNFYYKVVVHFILIIVRIPDLTKVIFIDQWEGSHATKIVASFHM